MYVRSIRVQNVNRKPLLYGFNYFTGYSFACNFMTEYTFSVLITRIPYNNLIFSFAIFFFLNTIIIVVVRQREYDGIVSWPTKYTR